MLSVLSMLRSTPLTVRRTGWDFETDVGSWGTHSGLIEPSGGMPSSSLWIGPRHRHGQLDLGCSDLVPPVPIHW